MFRQHHIPFQQENPTATPQSAVMAKSFISKVFTLMIGALGLSALLAYLFSQSAELMQYIIYYDPVTQTGGHTTLGYVVMFAPLIFVITMAFAFKRFSALMLTVFFMAFAAIMGISLSTIFLAYSSTAIITTFLISSATFGIMAVVGYTTNTDLTKFGSILMMGLIGIILAMVVNFFLESSSLEYLISCIGVLIFTGLVAYDTQKLKNIGSQVGTGSETAGKLVVMGALSLYLDFINLFLFLLRIFGGRD